MISHSGLVCFPTAGNAPVGRRRASTKAHASTTKAATRRTQFTQLSGVSALNVNTGSIYLLAAAGGSVHGSASAAATVGASGSWPDSSYAWATGSEPAAAPQSAPELVSAPGATSAPEPTGAPGPASALSRARLSALTSLRNDS